MIIIKFAIALVSLSLISALSLTGVQTFNSRQDMHGTHLDVYSTLPFDNTGTVIGFNLPDGLNEQESFDYSTKTIISYLGIKK